MLGVAGASIATDSLHAKDDSRGKRPNIVVFISDDHGLDFVGCYGNKDIKTPNVAAFEMDGL